MSDEIIIDNKSILIHKHQVAGHLPLLYDSTAGTVCKPAHDAEVAFYDNINNIMPQLNEFLPKVFGIVDMKQLNSNKNKNSTNNNEIHNNNNNNNNNNNSNNNNNNKKKEKVLQQMNDEKSNIVNKNSNNNNNISQKVSSHGWGKKVAIKKQMKLQNDPNLRFLCMEDLTKGYRRPCILDVKVGTQQHHPRESAEKIRSKMLKCATSTSSTLGLRLSGSQIYRKHGADESFLCRDKYYGRKLNEEEFRNSLNEFFDNGDTNSKNVIPFFLERLYKFKNIVTQPNPYKFYSSSLLFIYDVGSNSNCDIDLRLIDFASVDVVETNGVDEGMLLGLDNIIKILKNIYESSKTN